MKYAFAFGPPAAAGIDPVIEAGRSSNDSTVLFNRSAFIV